MPLNLQALLNGIPLSEKRLNADEFEEGVLSEIMTQTPQLQKAVFKEEFVDTDSAIDFLMSRPNVMPRLVHNSELKQIFDQYFYVQVFIKMRNIDLLWLLPLHCLFIFYFFYFLD